VTSLVYSAAAERDLTRIAMRIAADNRQAALRFVAGIREHCLLLRTVRFMGRQRSDIHPDIRSFPHGAYVVYYWRRPDLDQIEILRVWHGRRQAPMLADLT
jgi:toxin ParE1/3/4